MTYSQWTQTIESKIGTSWNLHKSLPHNMDFFVLLSSLAGIYGSRGQSNYAAGCTFQDALARYHPSVGFSASISIDLGLVRSIGYVAEKAAPKQSLLRALQTIGEKDILCLLEHYCDPTLPLLSEAQSQILIGVDHLGRLGNQKELAPPGLAQPLFAGFSGPSAQQREHVGAEADEEDFAQRFALAFDSPRVRYQIVLSAITKKLSQVLNVQPDDINAQKYRYDYGVDSLMAVELRNWIRRDFHATVTVFEIMGGTSIDSVTLLIVERSD